MWKKFIEWRTTNDIDNAFVMYLFIKKFKLPEIIKVRK